MILFAMSCTGWLPIPSSIPRGSNWSFHVSQEVFCHPSVQCRVRKIGNGGTKNIECLSTPTQFIALNIATVGLDALNIAMSISLGYRTVLKTAWTLLYNVAFIYFSSRITHFLTIRSRKQTLKRWKLILFCLVLLELAGPSFFCEDRWTLIS